VLSHNGKLFVSFDFGASGGVLMYNHADVYPVRTAVLPVVISAGGASCCGMAIEPVSGDLFIATFSSAVYRYTAVSGYTTGSVFASGGSLLGICANLVFDSGGNLWVSNWNYNNVLNDHQLTCFKGLNPATAYVFENKAVEDQYTAYGPGGNIMVNVFSAPEGMLFDLGGNLLVCNNNDGARTNEAGQGTLVRISGSWIAEKLAGNAGSFEVPTDKVSIRHIPSGKLGGMIRLGLSSVCFNDQGTNQTLVVNNTPIYNHLRDGEVWMIDQGADFQTTGPVPTGIHTIYPGNGSMTIFEPDIPLVPETNLSFAIIPVGAFVKGSEATFQITITNIGAQAIPAGFRTTGYVTTVLGPSQPGFQHLSLTGSGWFTTFIGGPPRMLRRDGLAAGQSYPPLFFKIQLAANTNTAYAATEGSCSNEVVYDENVAYAQGITVDPPNAIQQWRIQNFGNANPEEEAADDAAPVGDGIPNLMKFALDLDPNEPAVLQERVDDVLEGGQLAFDIVRNPAAVGAGLVYVVEQTTNLADPNSWTSNGVTVNIDTPSRLKATLNQPVLSGAAFMRLKVLAP
jgi:hypothetical protein